MERTSNTRNSILLALSLLVGCSADNGKVARVLEHEGCTQTVVGGWEFFNGCGEKDTFTNSFSCVKNGTPVKGWVCSGLLKGYTVRYDE